MKLFTTICWVVILFHTAHGQAYTPPKGFVPDAATAVRIAEAVLIPVYGERKVESERPFKAALNDKVWTVTGSLHCTDGNGGVTTNCFGGVATVQISKSNARIISMAHYK